MISTVVLVHGAWHGAWCWERVIDGLCERGVPTIAVDLPGHGEDPGPMGDLHGDAARVTDVIDSIGGPVVLVGHSYGGAVITEAGVHPSVAQLVYLCAFALKEGETCWTAAVDDPRAAAISHVGRPKLRMLEIGEGGMVLDPTVASAVLYNDCDRATVVWALERLGPQPKVTLQQVPRRFGWQVKPSTYVVCTNDLAVHPDLQRLLADRCSERLEWDSDHSPFLSHPEQVIGLLAGLAASEA